MAALRYTSEWPSEDGSIYRIQIWDRDGSGDATAIEVGSSGFELRFSGEGSELLSPMMGTECTVRLYSIDEITDSIIPDIISSSEGRFVIKILKDNILDWIGGVLPDVGSYEEAYYPFAINLRATDGLATLRDMPYFSDDEEPFTGKERAIEHLCRALKKINYVFDFIGDNDFFVRSAVDWWESRMTNDPNGADALYYTWIDHATWYEWRGGKRDYKTCWEVVETIVKEFRARISQYQGAFWIEQRSYRTADTVVIRRYDKSGAFRSSVNFSGVHTVNQTQAAALVAVAQYEFFPPIADHTHTFKTQTRRNFLQGITPYDENYFDAQVIPRPVEANGGKTTLRFTANLRVTIKSLNFAADYSKALDPFTLYFHLSVYLDSVGMQRDITLIATNYQIAYGVPFWGATPLLVIAVPITASAFLRNISDETFVFTQTIDIFSAPLPESSKDVTFNFIRGPITKYDGTQLSENDFDIQYDLTEAWLEAYSNGGPVRAEDEIEYIAKNTLFPKNSVSTKTESIIGTATDPNTLGALWIRTSASPDVFALTQNWGDGSDAADREIEDHICELTVSAQHVPIRKLSGVIFGDIRAFFRIDWGGVKWLLVGGTWTAARSEFSGEWAEMKYAAGLSTSPPRRKMIPIISAGIPEHPGKNGNAGENQNFAERPPASTFGAVAVADTTAWLFAGGTTSVPVAALTAQAFLAGETIAIIHPFLGAWDTLGVAATSEAGDEEITVYGTLTADYPPRSSIVKKTALNLRSVLDSLPYYESDEAAVGAGLAVGDWYIASEGHVSAAPGTLKKVMEV